MIGYLQTIIWTMLFVVVVEMIFPSSDIKKYLKLVLGFLVIYVVLSPLVSAVTATNLLPEEANLWDKIRYYQDTFGQETTYGMYESEVVKQQEGMQDIYQQQLEESAKRIVEKKIAVEVVAIDVTTGLANGQFDVSEVVMTVALPETEQVFGMGVGRKDESIVLNEEILKKEIKNCLNDFYNWDKANIYITVQEN